MKRLFSIVAIVAAIGLMPMAAQTANKALNFTTAGTTVDCGPVLGIDAKVSYTLQLWVKPAVWTANATLVNRGTDFSIKLGESAGTIVVTAGGKTITATSADLKAGDWAQITVVSDGGACKVLVNGTQAGTGELGSIPSARESMYLGGEGFTGCLDEVRLWACALPDTYNYFINTTIDRFNPNWDSVVAYYRMDYDCGNAVVDYKSLESPGAMYNNHGILPASGVARVAADNAKLPYLINSAYTANERFFDRAIPREQYLLSNDIVILGVESLPDGHVQEISPNNHATISGGVSYVASDGGRTGVASFDGTGTLTVSDTERCYSWTATGQKYSGATFETWVKVDEWTNGAFLMKKEKTTTSGGSSSTNGISVRLGSSGQIIVRVDGKDATFNTGKSTGEWFHLGVSQEYTDNNNTRTLSGLLVAVDGTKLTAASTANGFNYVPTLTGITTTTFGEGGFKGMLDNTACWAMAFNQSGFHRGTMPMPGLGVKIEAAMMMKANTLFTFDDSAKLGFDSYSQDKWRDIMKSAFEGYEGYKVRISVKSHTNWQSTISDATKRGYFATDVARIVQGYDGVELDLEWMDGEQTDLGLLAKAIHDKLPAGKSFHISIHAYGAFKFPTAYMQYVDGFTIQQYGVQKRYFPFSEPGNETDPTCTAGSNAEDARYAYYHNFIGSITRALAWGHTKEKLLTSFATTTSKGYDSNGVAKTEIAGFRAIVDANPNLDPSANQAIMEAEVNKVKGNYTFYFTGPMQAYQRAAYTVENGMQGIFYWDMANDIQNVYSPLNIARSASFGLNPAIARTIDEITPNHANVRTVIAMGDVTPDIFKFSSMAEGAYTYLYSKTTSTNYAYVAPKDNVTVGPDVRFASNNGGIIKTSEIVSVKKTDSENEKENVLCIEPNYGVGNIFFQNEVSEVYSPMKITIVYSLINPKSQDKPLQIGPIVNNSTLGAPQYEQSSCTTLFNGNQTPIWQTVTITSDNCNGFYFRCQQLGNDMTINGVGGIKPELKILFKEIKFETLIEMPRFDISLRGEFNGWSSTANGIYFDDVVDNCARFTVNDWRNGDGFKFVVDDNGTETWYGYTSEGVKLSRGWHTFTAGDDGKNALLADAANGKEVRFIFTTDNKTVNVDWDPTISLLGVNGWSDADAPTVINLDSDGNAVFTFNEWTEGTQFKFKKDGAWYSTGGTLSYGEETKAYNDDSYGNMSLPAGTVLGNVVITINPKNNTIKAVWRQKTPTLTSPETFKFYNLNVNVENPIESNWKWRADLQTTPASFNIVDYMLNTEKDFDYDNTYGYSLIVNYNYNMAGKKAQAKIQEVYPGVSNGHRCLYIPPTGAAGYGRMFFAPHLAAYLGNTRVTMQIRIENEGSETIAKNGDNQIAIGVVHHDSTKNSGRVTVEADYVVAHEHITNKSDHFNKWLEITFDAADVYALDIDYKRLLHRNMGIYIRKITFETINNPTHTGNFTVNASSMGESGSSAPRKAMSRAGEPTYAQWREVEAQTPTGVEDVAVDEEFGSVELLGSQAWFSAPAAVYTVGGAYVADVEAGQSLTLPAGLYVVRFANNATKFVVK